MDRRRLHFNRARRSRGCAPAPGCLLVAVLMLGGCAWNRQESPAVERTAAVGDAAGRAAVKAREAPGGGSPRLVAPASTALRPLETVPAPVRAAEALAVVDSGDPPREEDETPATGKPGLTSPHRPPLPPSPGRWPPDLHPPRSLAESDPVFHAGEVETVTVAHVESPPTFELPPVHSEAELELDSPPGVNVTTIGLDEAINSTLVNDPVLRAGFEAIRQAHADQITASLKPNPELEVLQTLLPLTRPFIADVREGGPPQLDVFVSYPIDWFLFGKRAAAMQSALRGVRVSEAEYADLVRQRVLETAIAYYDVLEAQALLELAQLDVENLRQTEEITRIAVEDGARPRVELSRIRLDRLIAEQTLREAQRDLTSARAELRALMGIGDSAPLYEAEGTLAAPLPHGPPEPAEAISLAEANRPDIQALRWQVAQGWAEVDVERREAYPEVTSMVGYTRQFQRRAIGFPDADSWGIGVSMELPFHDRNQGNRARALSELAQSGHELRAGLVELGAEVISVTAELETARTNAIATAEEQLELAEEVRESILQAYNAGARPLIDVLDSQRHFRETYRNYIESRADYWRAVHRFNAAIGTRLLQ